MRKSHNFIVVFVFLVAPLMVVAQGPAEISRVLADAEQRTSTKAINVSHNPAKSLVPTVEADDRGNVHVAWMDMSSGNPEILYSMWNGVKWAQPSNISSSDKTSAFPSLAVDAMGGVHLAWMEGMRGEFDIFHSKKEEDKWSKPSNLSKSKGIAQRPQLVFDSVGVGHVIWYDNRNGFLQLFHSQFDRETWSVPTNTGLVAWYITHDPSYGLAAGVSADNSSGVHVVWVDIYDSTQDLFHSHWDGKSWSTPENITTKRDVRSRPRRVETDADVAGNLHVTWEDNREVWYSRSDGNEWLKPHLLMGAAHQPRMPAICVAPTGVVHLAWTGFAFGDNNFCLLLPSSQW